MFGSSGTVSLHPVVTEKETKAKDRQIINKSTLGSDKGESSKNKDDRETCKEHFGPRSSLNVQQAP